MSTETVHVAACAWQRTTSADCEYRDTHHYCPHPEHACDCADYNMTEEQAEAVLREFGTSGKEIANQFIDRLLRERQEAIAALSSRDSEIREVLEGLGTQVEDGLCWCPDAGSLFDGHAIHGIDCQRTRTLYAKLQPDAPTPPKPIVKPSRRKSRKEQIEEELRASDLSGQLAQRDNIEYGPHDSLPRGEHVARPKKHVTSWPKRS